jgi:hypothetical protein
VLCGKGNVRKNVFEVLGETKSIGRGGQQAQNRVEHILSGDRLPISRAQAPNK